jgi:hypothetical protein
MLVRSLDFCRSKASAVAELKLRISRRREWSF